MSDRIPVIGVGAGGHAKVVIEILELAEDYRITGLLDADPALWSSRLLGISVIGDDTMLPQLYRSGTRHAFIGVGSAADLRPRQNVYSRLRAAGFEVVHAIHPNSLISPSVIYGPGATVMAGAVINSSATIGENVIVNTGVIVEHDCAIGDHVHLATGCRLAGNVTVGEGSHVGLGACIKQGINIGRRSVIGAGAVVVHDVPDGVVVAGVPARKLRDITQ